MHSSYAGPPHPSCQRRVLSALVSCLWHQPGLWTRARHFFACRATCHGSFRRWQDPWAGPPPAPGRCDVFQCQGVSIFPIGRGLAVCWQHQDWQQSHIATFAARCVTATSDDPAAIQAAITARLAGQGLFDSLAAPDACSTTSIPASLRGWGRAFRQGANGSFVWE